MMKFSVSEIHRDGVIVQIEAAFMWSKGGKVWGPQ